MAGGVEARGQILRRAVSGFAFAMLASPASAIGLADIFPDGVPGFGTEAGVTVRSRVRPDLEKPPLAIGGALLNAWLEEGVGYDSNVFSSRPARGSWTVDTKPSALVTAERSFMSFGAYAALADRRYLTLPAQGRTDGTASIGSSFAIGSDKLTLAFGHATQHEDRSALDTVVSDQPIQFNVDTLRASYLAPFGRWSFAPEIGVERWQYDPTTISGHPTSEAYRDRVVLRGGTTIRYEWAPSRNLVFVARALSQRYTSPLFGQPSSDSTGLQMLVGFEYGSDPVWRARVLAGAESRHFAYAGYRPHDGAIAEAELAWNPTGLTTLRLLGTRSMEDAAQAGVAGYTYSSGKLAWDHELRRDVLANASIGWRQAEYLQGGTQSGETAGLGLTWLFNRSARISATYDWVGVHGSGPSGTATGYNRDLALVMLRLGL